VYGLEYFDD